MNRLDAVRAAMNAAELDALLLSDVAEVSWATGFTGDDSHCLITHDGAWFFTDFRYTEQAVKEISHYEVVETGGANRLEEISKRLMGRLGIDYSRTTVSELEDYKKSFGGVSFKDASLKLNQLRAVKCADEISRMREGAVITEGAFHHLLGYIKEGVTENDIYAELVYYFNRHGAVPSFAPIIASGENGSMPHAGVTSRRIMGGDMVTMDFGVKYKGVCTDFTRTIALGGIEKSKLLVYNTVNSAQKAALRALKSGVSGKDVDAAARRVIDNAGYKGYFGHGTGHGVGVEIHEAPRLSVASCDILKEGMVVTVEPGIYIPGEYGVRIEDMLVVTKDGYENFYTADKEIIII